MARGAGQRYRSGVNTVVYANTVLDFDEGPTIDLREPLTPEERAAVEAHVGAKAFAIITADNPDGRVVEPEVNRRADERLRRVLARRGLVFREVVGRSPDASHQERSIAVPMPLDEARALGAEFRQVAVFWYEGGVFYLVECGGRGEVVGLPLARTRSRPTGASASSCGR